MNITVDGKQYQVILEDIQKGDLMLINNPHPLSSIKNRVERCAIVYDSDTGAPSYSFFIVTDPETKNGHHSGIFPKSMCKKVAEVDI